MSEAPKGKLVEIFTDGSYFPKKNKAAYGIVNITSKKYAYQECSCKNAHYAELYAINYAMNKYSSNDVIIYTDSKGNLEALRRHRAKNPQPGTYKYDVLQTRKLIEKRASRGLYTKIVHVHAHNKDKNSQIKLCNHTVDKIIRRGISLNLKDNNQSELFHKNTLKQLKKLPRKIKDNLPKNSKSASSFRTRVNYSHLEKLGLPLVFGSLP